MNIRHACPLPDLSFPVTAPLHLHKANGCKIVVRRWSLAGLWVEDTSGDLAGDVVLSVPFQGVEVSFPVTLAVADTPGQYHFVDLTVRQRETLSAFHQGVLSGQMVSTADMITSLDTPVDLVPMGETEEEEATGRARARPRFLRILGNSVVYLMLALILAAGLGGQIWQRLSQITLDHARFTAPVIEYTAPDAGYVARLTVKVGDDVAAGDVLAQIEDPDRRSDVEEVRTEVLLAERRLATAEDRLSRHLALRAARRAALFEVFQQLWLPWHRHDPRATRYPPRIEAAWRAVYAFDRGRDSEAGGYFDMLATLQSGVDERQLDLRRWKRELRHRKAAADKLVIRARSAGTVFAVHASKTSYVARNAPILEVEDRTPRVAVAWLDDSMARDVHIGMTADITYTFRGTRKNASGTVTDIQAGADQVRPDRFGMVLTVTADDVGLLNSRKWFRRNAPAHVTLNRRPVIAFWSEDGNDTP